jgi:hypothetical protein
MKKKSLPLALLFTLGLIAATTSQAIPIAHTYTGVAQMANASAGIDVGDTITLSFEYDSATAFFNGSGPGQNTYGGALSNIAVGAEYVSFALRQQ